MTQPCSTEEIPMDHRLRFTNIRIIDYVSIMTVDEIQTLTTVVNRDYIRALMRSMDDRKAPTWGGLEINGVPSPYIRIDGNIMEVESRPDGTIVQRILLDALLPRESSIFQAKVREALHKSGCASCIQFGDVVDDEPLAEIAELPYVLHAPHDASTLNLSGLHWIRSDTEIEYPDDFYRSIDPYSVVSNREDGNKDYLRHMGQSMSLWDYGMTHTKLPWKSGFVLKRAIHAARSSGVVVYRGIDAYTSIKEEGKARRSVDTFLQAYGTDSKRVILQAYQPPEVTEIDGTDYRGMPRYFFVWDYSRRRYEFAAGLVTARSESDVIHGAASDAVFWPITIR